MTTQRERVLALDGPLDGCFVELTPELSTKGVFLYEDGPWENPNTLIWGYYFHEWGDGFRVFRPGRRKDDQ